MTSGDDLLMAHGFSETIGLGDQVGIVTADDGETWNEFVIGAGYGGAGRALATRYGCRVDCLNLSEVRGLRVPWTGVRQEPMGVGRSAVV